MPLETKDIEPVITGISEIKAEQKTNATAISEVKTLAEEAKTVAGETKSTVEAIKTETAELKEWRVKKDEADQKNQEFLDKLSLEKKKRGYAGDETKSFEDILAKALEDNHDELVKIERKDAGRQKRLQIEIKDAGVITTGNVTGGVWGQVSRPGIIEQPKRKVHVRDLVPVGSLGPGTSYTFMYENGGEGAIAPTAETGEKPLFDIDLVEKTVNVETIAGRLKVTRKAMNNIPGFTSYLQSRLPELYLKAEDKQLLLGTGVSPQIKGIMTSGNYAAAQTDATVLIEAIIDSLAQLEDSDDANAMERNATGILLRPKEYYGFFKNQASGSGEYDLPANVTFANGTLFISGIPVYASTAMSKDASGNPMNKYIVGDWRMGAQLLIQNGMRMEFFEQDEDNVKYNRITVRIEADVAFPVFGSNYFIVGDVPEPISL